jgi:Flp pilus assembly pilin Flp
MLDRFSILIGRIAAFSLEDLKREDGQTTVEYAVVLVLVIAMAIAAFAALTSGVSSFMTSIGNQISGAASGI